MKNKIKFDPETYTIMIRREKIDDEFYYVGRVAELPNITAFEATYAEAHTIVVDAIQTFKTIADETGVKFPLPYPALSEEFSGRITLRVPKSLHAKVSFFAAQENVSINQYLTTAIAVYVGESTSISKVSPMMEMLKQLVSSASTIMTSTKDSFVANGSFLFINKIKTDPQTTKLIPNLEYGING